MPSSNDVIEPNKLAFDGSGYLAWEGLICTQEVGKCTEEHQALVRKWLEDHKLEDVRVSELFRRLVGLIKQSRASISWPILSEGVFKMRKTFAGCCFDGNRIHRPCGV